MSISTKRFNHNMQMKKRQCEKNSPANFGAKRKNKNCSRAKGIRKYKNFDKPKDIKKYFLIPRNFCTKEYMAKRMFSYNKISRGKRQRQKNVIKSKV